MSDLGYSWVDRMPWSFDMPKPVEPEDDEIGANVD